MFEPYGHNIALAFRWLVILESEFAPLSNNPGAIAPDYQSNQQGQAYNFASFAIDQIWALAEELNLHSTLHGIRRAKTAMSLKGSATEFVDAVRQTRARLEENLSTKNFFFVPDDHMQYWGRKGLFGDNAVKKFISAAKRHRGRWKLFGFGSGDCMRSTPDARRGDCSSSPF